MLVFAETTIRPTLDIQLIFSEEDEVRMKVNTDVFVRFETLLHSQKLSPLTITAYLSAVKRFLQDIDTIDYQSVLNWAGKIADHYKPSTVNLYYSAVRRFLEETSPQTLLKLKNKLKIRGMSSSIPKVLSEQELAKLWNRALKIYQHDCRPLLIVGLAGYAGLRVSEITSLRASHIHLKENHILVNGKGKKMRIVPIPSKLRPYISQVIQSSTDDGYLLKNHSGGQLSIHGVSYLLKKLAKDAGVRCVSPHMLRHTAATTLLKKGVNLKIVQEFLGHTSLATTERYLRVTVTDLKESLKKRDIDPLF